MENKLNLHLGNKPPIRGKMTLYKIMKENEKSEPYNKNIMKICNQHPLNDQITHCKIQSQTPQKPYRSIKTRIRLLKVTLNNFYKIMKFQIQHRK